MDAQTLQTLIAAFVVAAAALFVGARFWRAFSAARRKDAGCGGDCGCGK